jgi:hypothetical protein
VSKLTGNIAEAWMQRAQAAVRDFQYAQQAPALFKPGWSERAAADYAAAQQQAAYWMEVGA